MVVGGLAVRRVEGVRPLAVVVEGLAVRRVDAGLVVVEGLAGLVAVVGGLAVQRVERVRRVRPLAVVWFGGVWPGAGRVLVAAAERVEGVRPLLAIYGRRRREVGGIERVDGVRPLADDADGRSSWRSRAWRPSSPRSSLPASWSSRSAWSSCRSSLRSLWEPWGLAWLRPPRLTLLGTVTLAIESQCYAGRLAAGNPTRGHGRGLLSISILSPSWTVQCARTRSPNPGGWSCPTR